MVSEHPLVLVEQREKMEVEGFLEENSKPCQVLVSTEGFRVDQKTGREA